MAKTTACHVATRKGLFTITRGASGWSVSRVSFLGDNCTLVLHDARNNSLLAALNHGHFGVKLHRSRDGGATWTEIGAPAYPPMPEGYVPKMTFSGKPIDWTLRLVWALAPGGDDRPSVLWCGTMPGGLFKSEDNGDSWVLNRALWDDPLREQWNGGGAEYPGLHSICVNPRDSDDIVVGVSTGGAWTTRDGGNSWRICGKGMRAEYMPPELQFEPNAQDAHLVVQCAASPAALWVQHHNGIFRSTDRAASWSEIANVHPSAFGFAVAVHPRDPETAWFVPAVKDEKRYPAHGRVVVNRTHDGGKTFQTLTRGLPQEHAYDLVYRHALDIDDSGEALAFGSTTGSLWVSEDSGESWQTVSSNLPPIHSVRFERA
jgi:hypothetical protein